MEAFSQVLAFRGGVVKMETDHLTICEGDQDSAAYLQQRLIAYNMEQIPLEGKPVSVIIKEPDRRIVGGISVSMMYLGLLRIILFRDKRSLS